MTRLQGSAGPCAIVLAAGRSTRFGSNKLLAPFRGAPLLAHPLRVLGQASLEGLIARAVAVIRPDNAELADLVRSTGAEPVFQSNPLASHGSSLRLGLHAARGCDSAMVVLGDQPFLRIEAIREIVATAASRPDALVRVRYTDTPAAPGHPVLIPSAWWHLADAELGFRNAGAAGLREEVVLISGDNPDVDTPDALRALDDRPD